MEQIGLQTQKLSGNVIDFEEKHAQALIALALKVKTRKH